MFLDVLGRCKTYYMRSAMASGGDILSEEREYCV